MRQVLGWGNPAARYILIGEAPGPTEEETGEPFVGASGWRLKDWWGRAGLKREDFRIENVCVEASTPVLMADLSWKAIKEIRVGDKLLAFDEDGKTRGEQLRRWRISEVLATSTSVRECLKLTSSTGSLILTPEHRILGSTKRNNAALHWIKANNVCKGTSKHGWHSYFSEVFRPWEFCRNADPLEIGWVAGILDGEGSISASHAKKLKRNITISIGQNDNCVLKRYCELVKKHGFRVGVYKTGNCHNVRLLGGVAETIRFLAFYRPVRLLEKFYKLVQEPPVIRFHSSCINKKEWVGEHAVVDIQTTTKTFIANGFGVHNCEFRPPHNNIEAFDTAYLQQWMGYLQQRISGLGDPWILVPCGNYALYALTGKGKVKWHTHDGKQTRAGITDWRGSILEYTDLNGRKIKVVPTIHPAATFRQPDYEGVCIRDWIKIAHEGTFRETRLPQRVHATKPTLLEVDAYLRGLRAGSVVAVDIENPKPKEPLNEKVVAPIVCLGFADRPDASLTIPVTRDYWGSEGVVEQVWKLLSNTLQRHDISWVFHNGLYDTFHLTWERGIHVGNYQFDTLYMHHCLDPSDWHSLDYCASRDTREPFWKHEAKDPDEAAKYSSNLEAFWVYNGKDAAVTRELYDVYHHRLCEQGRLDFYQQHYAALLEPLQSLQLHGVKVDDSKRKLRLAHLMADCLELQDQLEEKTGLKLYGKSSLSNTKLKHYLYDVLGLPKQERTRKERGEKTVTADELAVRRLMLKHKKELADTGPLILAHKRKSKLREFCDEGRTDVDGYFRSSYSMNTEAGRLSSKANPNGTGGNAQNQDRELRDMFLPDDGMVGIEVDGSQVEARIDYALIYMLTGNKAMYDKAMMRPDEYDQHTENASVIFQVATEAVTKDQRYLGKKCVHGAFRDMQGQKLADELLKDGYVLTAKECGGYIEEFKKRVPGIDELFRWCRRQVIEHRFCESTWGHRLYFTYDRFSDEVYRKAYSFYPQADCAGWMNSLGLVPFFWYIEDMSKREGRPIGYINVHAHDALFFSVLPEYAYDATKFLVDSMEQNWLLQPKHSDSLRVFRVPCTVKLGKSWKCTTEFNRLPSQQEFTDAVYSLQH